MMGRVTNTSTHQHEHQHSATAADALYSVHSQVQLLSHLRRVV